MSCSSGDEETGRLEVGLISVFIEEMHQHTIVIFTRTTCPLYVLDISMDVNCTRS